MHVGRRTSDLTKRRRFERTAVRGRSGDDKSAEVFPFTIVPRHARVVKGFVAQRRARVTSRTAALSSEDLQSSPSFVRQRIAVAARVPIERRVPGENCSHVTGERAREILSVRRPTEDCSEAKTIDIRSREPAYGFVDSKIQLARIADRLEHLFLQCPSTTVPELRLSIAAVDQSRSAPRTDPSIYSNSDRSAVRECAARIVAVRTGDRAVPRKNWITEQLPAERHLRRRQLVVLRDRKVQVQSQRNYDGGRDQQPDHCFEAKAERKFSSTQTSVFRSPVVLNANCLPSG